MLCVLKINRMSRGRPVLLFIGGTCLVIQELLDTIDFLWSIEADPYKRSELNILWCMVEQSQSCPLLAGQIDWNALSAMHQNIITRWKQSIPDMWSVHAGVVLSDKSVSFE